MSAYPPWGMLGPAAIARWALATRAASVSVDGAAYVPDRDPVLLVARHYHHLLDGAVILRAVRRPVHIVVGLDWAASARQRRWMERACRAADYPIVLRPATLGTSAGYRRDELLRYTRGGLTGAAALLRAGRVVLVFPEGYPVVDPAAAKARTDDGLLPFAGGWRRIVAYAERAGGPSVAIVPVGLRYERAPGGRWNVAARFGSARGSAQIDAVESEVRALSDLPEKTKTAAP